MARSQTTLNLKSSPFMLLAAHNKAALIPPDSPLTYAQPPAAAHSYAALFSTDSEQGLIFPENRPEWVYAAYASRQNQRTGLPVDHLSTVKEVTFIIKDCLRTTPPPLFADNTAIKS